MQWRVAALVTLLIPSIGLEALGAPPRAVRPAATPVTVTDSSPAESHLPSPLTEKQHFWVAAGARSGTKIGAMYNGEFAVGWQWGLLGIDAHVAFGSAPFGGIFSQPSYTDVYNAEFESALDPNSELNRARLLTDSWSYFTYQPGLVVHGRAFPDLLPEISQKARVGLGPGTFTDKVNQLSFSAWIFTAEAAVQWQLQKKGRLALEFAFSMNWGRLVGPGAGSANLRRIPTIYYTFGPSLVAWF